MNGLLQSKKNRFKIDIPDKNSQVNAQKLAKICCKLNFLDPKGDLGENLKPTKLKISVGSSQSAYLIWSNINMEIRDDVTFSGRKYKST